MENNNKKKVADIWDNNWKKQKKLPRQYGLSRLIYRILKREIGSLKGEKILEAGSGTGLSSLLLARSGADMALLDISPNAIEISKKVFGCKNINADFVCASVFDMPFADGTFDSVWNAGVIEHFRENEQYEMLKEMIRVCRVNGKIILLNPYNKAYVYRLSKKYSEKKSRWGSGDEYPVISLEPVLKGLEAAGIREYSVGFLEQLNFLEIFFTFSRYSRISWIAFYRIIQRLFWFLDYLPGYLLVTVFEKRKVGDAKFYERQAASGSK